uniref:AAA domain-containing protein n=1 Tax=Candidatus Kentrum sp. TUN TaxID=2126343 RepID=A0A451A254_9GAMM|nr:MAG: AAA domain-containing protein [Candidatus Kentron sp. TUN]VFK69556.1 MAG: AAA domain-containing protein [Candidatus Kentron sp. TUN]
MKIEILNCNNIEQGTFEIRENVLNIKYAINGAGKSTLAKAIAFSVMDRLGNKKQLSELTPFKYQGNAERAPQVKGIEGISSIRIFDEDYVNDFVFQPDELLKGSFDIFIRGEDYEKGIQIIDKLVNEIKKLLAEDKDIEGLIRDLTELSNGFGKPTQKGIHGSSPLSKALKGGNKVANIPVGLEDYKDFIQGAENFKWIKWQMDGKAFIDISERCPYCVGDISEKKGRIRRISEEYDAKSVENLNKMVEVFQRLNQYFSESTRKKIDEFVENTSGYTEDQTNFLRDIRDQIDRLRGKFSKAQSIGFHSLKDVDKVVEELKSYCIDLGLFNHLQSENTESKAKVVNDSIDRIQEKAGELQGNINKQKILIEKLVKENSTEINNFLRNAGYSYSVDIKPDGNGEYRLKLTHNDIDGEVSNVRTHLSYGERNAFALVLFMYDVLKKNPDLIVLDDPISSFDKNKKYAIVDMLFRKGGSLRGKTVLLLTHDFEPIVDMVKHHSDRFEGLFGSFLENTHGSLAEKGIVKADICSFIDISNENIRDAATPLLSKLVYLRRLFEVTNEKGLDYHIISNLFHKREKPKIPGEDGMMDMMNRDQID